MKILVAAMLAAVAASNAAAAELQLPHHKPGLWQNEIVASGETTNVQICYDEASETALHKLSEGRCTDRHVAHNPDGSWSTSATCKIVFGFTRSIRSEISGDFDKKLKTTSYKMPDNTLQSTETSTWAGPCKPDQKGGDVITSSGTKINMLDVMGKL